MRSAVVVFGAISTIEITTIRHVKTALQRFPVDEALAGFQNVIAGKFAADFVQELHAVTKEDAAYDNLPAKQSGREISLHNARDPSWRVSNFLISPFLSVRTDRLPIQTLSLACFAS